MLNLAMHLSEHTLTHDIESTATDSGIRTMSLKVLKAEPTDYESMTDNSILNMPTLLEILVLDERQKVGRLVYVVESSDLLSSDVLLAPLIDDGFDCFMASSLRQRKDDFVVDSDGNSENEDYLPPSPPQQRIKHKPPSGIDLSHIAAEISNRLHTSYVQTQAIGSSDSALASILRNDREIQTGVQTLVDLLPSPPPVDQIDVVSRKLSRLLNSIRTLAQQIPGIEDGPSQTPHKIELSKLLLQPMVDQLYGISNDDDELDTVHIYDMLLRLHLHTLPNDTPPALKVWLENMIRQTSTQLFLSGHGIQFTAAAGISRTAEADASMADDMQAQDFELPVRPRGDDQDVAISSSQPRRSRRSASAYRPSSSQSSMYPSSQQTSDMESEYLQPLGLALADYITVRLTSPLPQSMRNGVPEWQIGVQPSGDEWKSISRSVSQESLRNPRRDRKRKRDKGKGKANATTIDETVPQINIFQPNNSSQPTDNASPRPDLDDLLLGSQPVSSQILPLRPQHLGADIPSSSQFLPFPSSQPINHGSSSQNKTKRTKKLPPVKKRPSGFR